MEGPKKAAIASAFKKFDINGDGTISEEELRRVMMALDPSLSQSDLEIIFSGADLSKDGAVSLEEFATWAAEPQGMFGMVPANAANALTREEQAALRIQSLARGRAGRKRVKSEKKVAPVAVAPVMQVEPITRVELWEGLAFDRGRIRPKIDVFELVSGFNGCKRTGLSPVVADVLGMDGEDVSFDLVPEQVNHLALMICGSREPLSEMEAREEMLKIKALVQACCSAIRSEEKMALRHFKNWCTLLAHLMQLDLSVIIFQWYWFEFGLFLPTVEVAEALLVSTVYSEQRLKALASRNDMDLDDLKGKLLNFPFNLRDLMQLVYNGGLCGRPDCHCLLPSEVEALWPHLLRNVPARTSQLEMEDLLRSVTNDFRLQMPRSSERKCKGYAFVEGDFEVIQRLAAFLWQGQVPTRRSTRPLKIHPADGFDGFEMTSLTLTMPRMVSQRQSLRRGVAMGSPRKEELDRDVRKDLEKSHLLGLDELSILLEQLYDNDKMKSRFPSPLEMVCGMVKHSEQCGRLWDDNFVEPEAP
eukprot:s424_g4.t2